MKGLNSPKVLHIATHGFFLENIERLSDDISYGMQGSKFVENPLLRSMLLFAGAESSFKATSSYNRKTDDGLLTALETMNLNLDNTELVVLSACETGLGEIRNGEGVYGLHRAFQVAGAKTVVISLWKVSDEPTQELMSNFYSNWVAGMTKREAFGKAQQVIKAKFKHPFYWGAFVMIGE